MTKTADIAEVPPSGRRMSAGQILALAVRELRSGLSGFYIFIACVALGVMVITGVGAVTDALRGGFERQGEAILGGDVTLARMHARADAATRAWLDAQGFDATKEVSMAKAYCGELVNEVLYDCVQFHGGMGYMRETLVERLYRDARVYPIGGGATEVMLEEVAKRM